MFSKLRGLFTSNLHDEWPPEPTVPLAFELSPPSLSGVGIGAPVEDLQRFGKPDNKARAKDGYFFWYRHGFAIDTDARGVDSFLFKWKATWEPGYGKPNVEARPFAGTCTLDGNSISLGATTTETQVVELMGEPESRDEEDPDDVVLRWNRDGIVYEFEFTAKRQLKALLCYGE